MGIVQLILCGFCYIAIHAQDPEILANEGNVLKLFDSFTAKFKRDFGSPEERERRLIIFMKNLATIAQRQLQGGRTAEYSYLTKFADWTPEEFASYNKLRVDKEIFRPAAKLDDFDRTDLPTDFDWRGKGAVTRVKDQGHCSSGWAFSAIGNIEGINFVKTGELLELSAQQLVDCATSDGCYGYLDQDDAYNYLLDNNTGLELEEDYSNTPSDSRCKAEKEKEQVYIYDWLVMSDDEDVLAQELMTFGPMSIGINSTDMQFYSGGIADPSEEDCDHGYVDHYVTLVGFGTSTGKPYWVIKNSWGEDWGEDGYYRIVRGKNACGLNNWVTTALITNKFSQNSKISLDLSDDIVV